MGRGGHAAKAEAEGVVLLDTDFLIKVEKGRARLPQAFCYISVVTLYEYIRGKSDPLAAKNLLEEAFVVIPLDNEVLLKATEIWRDLKRRGLLIDERDLLIGATAIAKGLPLATYNVKHYSRLVNYGLKFYAEK